MKLRTIELNESQRTALQEGYCEGERAVFRKRCQIILLKSQGRTSLDVGKIVGMNQNTVNNWLTRYEQEGIEGLHTKLGRGRKPILDIEKDGELVKEVVKEERQRLKQAKNTLERQLNKNFSTKTLKRFLKSLAADGNASAYAPKVSQTLNF